MCRPYEIFDIENVTLPDDEHWKETQDHSKWAIGINKYWVCVGDINRQHGQLSRGGGTYCRYDKSLWTAFQSLVQSYNSTCPT